MKKGQVSPVIFHAGRGGILPSSERTGALCQWVISREGANTAPEESRLLSEGRRVKVRKVHFSHQVGVGFDFL